MLLLIRFAVILLFIGCIIALPLFLMKLNKMETRKKEEMLKEAARKVMKKEPPAPPKTPHSDATAIVGERFNLIETTWERLAKDKKSLSLESAHTITETFPSDYRKYKEAYLKLTNKRQVEEEVLPVLDRMIQELQKFENEIEEKKKAELDRQGYIIENREKKHL